MLYKNETVTSGNGIIFGPYDQPIEIILWGPTGVSEHLEIVFILMGRSGVDRAHSVRRRRVAYRTKKAVTYLGRYPRAKHYLAAFHGAEAAARPARAESRATHAPAPPATPRSRLRCAVAASLSRSCALMASVRRRPRHPRRRSSTSRHLWSEVPMDAVFKVQCRCIRLHWICLFMVSRGSWRLWTAVVDARAFTMRRHFHFIRIARIPRGRADRAAVADPAARPSSRAVPGPWPVAATCSTRTRRCAHAASYVIS